MTDVLEEKYPGYRDQEPFEAGPFRGRLVARRREVKSHPCYVHGYEIGEDIETFFSATVLVLPPEGSDAEGWCTLETSGYDLASDRYSQASRRVSCTLSEGGSHALEHRAYTQKPGRRPLDEEGSLRPLQEHLQSRMGYADATEEAVAQLVSAFAARFAH